MRPARSKSVKNFFLRRPVLVSDDRTRVEAERSRRASFSE